MKNSFKISALVLAFAGLSFGANAQTTTTKSSSTSSNGIILSVGVDAGIPTGDYKSAYNWNLGGSVQADIPVLTKSLYVTVNAGYDNIFGKNNIDGSGLDATNIQLLPVKAGLKYFIVPHFYVQGEAGAAFLLNKSDLAADKSAAFVYAPQLGYQFPLSGKSFIDAGVRYESAGSFYNAADDAGKTSFLGLRIAYAFSTK